MIVREESGVPLAVTGLVAYRDEPVLRDVSWSVRGEHDRRRRPNAGKTTLPAPPSASYPASRVMFASGASPSPCATASRTSPSARASTGTSR